MDTGRTLEVLKKLTYQDLKLSRLCTVKSVDEDKLTCDVNPNDNTDIIFYDVRLSVTDAGLNITIPKVGSSVIVSEFVGGRYISMFSEIEKYYQATATESTLDIMLDFISAIKAIQLTTPQGPSTPNGVINIQSFIDLEQRLKAFYLK